MNISEKLNQLSSGVSDYIIEAKWRGEHRTELKMQSDLLYKVVDYNNEHSITLYDFSKLCEVELEILSKAMKMKTLLSLDEISKIEMILNKK